MKEYLIFVILTAITSTTIVHAVDSCESNRNDLTSRIGTALEASLQKSIITIPERGKSTYLAATSSEVNSIVGLHQSATDEHKMASLITIRAAEVCKFNGGKLLDFEIASSKVANQFYMLNQGRLSVVDASKKLSFGSMAVDVGLFLATGGFSALATGSAGKIVTSLGGEAILNFGFHSALKQFNKIDLKGMYSYNYVYFKNIACLPAQGLSKAGEEAARVAYFCGKSETLRGHCASIRSFKDFQCIELAVQKKYSFDSSQHYCQKFSTTEALNAEGIFEFCRNAPNSAVCIEAAKSNSAAALKSCGRFWDEPNRARCLAASNGRGQAEVSFCYGFDTIAGTEACYKALPRAAGTHPEALNACAGFGTLDARQRCLAMTISRAPHEIDFCDGYGYLTFVEKCFKGLPAGVDPHVLNACNYNNLGLNLECVAFTNGHTQPEIEYCEFGSLPITKDCLQGLPKGRHVDPKVLKDCSKYMNVKERIKCANGIRP